MARRGFGPPRSARTPPIRSAVQRKRLLTVSAFCFTARRASLGRALCSYRARGAGLPGAINVWEGCDSRRLQLARETGALTELPFALDALSAAYTFAGEPAEAASLIDPNWGLGELIVAAFRSGKTERAADALHRLSAMTHASGTDRALGIEARSRARLSDGDTAERLYLEAIGRLGRTRIRVELARAHLLCDEWLRRERWRLDARAQLRAAHEMSTGIGAAAFADRAALEPLATAGRAAQTHGANPGRPDPRRRFRSRGWPARSSSNPRWARGCSSARTPSNTTCTRSSSSELDRRLGGTVSDHAEPRSPSHGQDGDRVWGPRLGSGYAALGNAIGCADGTGDSKRVASVARSPAPPTTT